MATNSMYAELAHWWPLISPPEDYAEEAAFVGTLLDAASPPVTDVLELGSGGGHNAFHLAGRFRMTLVDLSDRMLDVSRRLNPGCVHVRADMRTVRLDRQFDAVFVHDAVDYMTSEDDLRAAFLTAFLHCRPGGTAVFVPDNTVETFEPEADHGGTDGRDGRGVRFLSWTWDPDPTDHTVRTDYAFLLRGRDGTVEVVHDVHRTGLFSRATWLDLLHQVGFSAERVTEVTTEERTPRDVFVARRP